MWPLPSALTVAIRKSVTPAGSAGGSGSTSVGDGLLVSVPLPSWARSFWPQQDGDPLVVTPQTWRQPPSISRMSAGPASGEVANGLLPSPMTP